MKSRGKNLDRAYQQAIDYTHGLTETELPKYILVSDFASFRLFDLDENKRYDFALTDLVSHVQLFGFIAGYQKRSYKEEDPVNIEAAYHMGVLHDALKEAGYTGRDLEIYLVRLLFCLFADDTGIFERSIFLDYLNQKTNTDGSDLGMHLAQLFQVLNTPNDKRQRTLDESLAQFPYINGHLFEQQLPFASFNSRMRTTLLQCCSLDWNKISPAIFGSMFQSVMNETERRNLGAHYTSEKNILKLIKPLFLDALWQEFATARTSSGKLRTFHKKVASLRFLDPACGCGNFLVITYRELRLLELAILKELQRGQMVSDISQLVLCDVDRFYGIEYEEFPAQIAQVALWLTDHQMNMQVSAEFGEYFVRLPLKKSAKIVHGNALRTDWGSLVEPLPWETTSNFDYIIGNPPFVGSKWMSSSQREDIKQFENEIQNNGILDYVASWFIKSAQLIQGTKIKVAFVSTNSISQGEQAGTLWNPMFNKYNIKIHFAHRTFNWKNEARGNAAVHVVIIGFANFDCTPKFIFEYNDNKDEPFRREVKNVSPYLIEGPDFAITNRSNPICDVPQLKTGNKPIDGGNYIFSLSEMLDFIIKEPESKEYFREFIGSEEFINGNPRYILWLKDIDPSKLKSLPLIKERIEKVIKYRKSSNSLPTQKLASLPTRFHTENYPTRSFLIIPEVSSERRNYIPIGFENPGIVCSNKLRLLDNANLYQFGILVSKMHMNWMKTVTGRLKSDYQYSVSTVYNNFPWPENPTDKQKEAIETAAQKVLDVRLEFPGSSLADLYNPLTMPPALVKVHNELDKAVDLAYRPQPFANETNRIEYLFGLYDTYTAGLFVKPKKKPKK
jgi:type I restriction-modification system DNA methylase subunit